MHPELLDLFAAHPDCYFQVFTNGQLITDEIARELARLGNVTPLVSIEGSEIASDERREHRAVGIRDPASGGHRSGRQELVSRRDDPHPRPTHHLDFRAADRRQQADILRPQRTPGAAV